MGASCSKQDQQVTNTSDTTNTSSSMEEGSSLRTILRDDPDDGVVEAPLKRHGSSLLQRQGVTQPEDETENTTTNDMTCSWFDELSDETLLHILSFVSYAPFEVGVVVGWEDGRKRLVYKTMGNGEADNDSQQKLDVEHKRLIKEYCSSAQEYNNTKTKRRKTQNTGAGHENDQSQGSSSLSPSGFFSRFMNRSQSKRRPSCLFVDQPERFGTLTHVLPLVNQRWYNLTTIGGGLLLWTEALERNIRLSVTWERSFDAYWEELLPLANKPEGSTTTSEDDGKQNSPTSQQDRIQLALALSRQYDHFPDATSDESCIARELYRTIKDKRQLRLPIFRMAMAGCSYETSISLVLFEPRYCLMIRQAMSYRSEQECTGHAIAATRPRFLFAAFGNARHAALLVEIWSCHIRPDGTAEVTIRPVTDHPLVAMVDVHVRPDTGGLQEATLLMANSVVFSNRTKTFPVFVMSVANDFMLQNHIFLRFFEDRYKLLIAEIMRERSDDERQGEVMVAPFPQFLFVFNPQSLEARILDVVQCAIHPDGSADLVCRQDCWVAICSKRMRPGSGGLYDATVLLPSDE